MSNHFLVPVEQGLTGVLKSIVTSSVDRANEINRAVCEYRPCSVEAFFDPTHGSSDTILSGGEKSLRSEAICAQIQAAISHQLPVIILHEGDVHLERVLEQKFSSSRRYR